MGLLYGAQRVHRKSSFVTSFREALPVGPIVKTLIFSVIVPGAVAVYLPLWLVSSGAVASYDCGPARYLGLVLLALGFIGYILCAFEFSVHGRGTPAPIDPPKVLVARGIYRYVRNPMYLSVFLANIGWAALLCAPGLAVYALIVILIQAVFVVVYEQPTLRRMFGESYEQYCRDVPGWIPKL